VFKNRVGCCEPLWRQEFFRIAFFPALSTPRSHLRMVFLFVIVFLIFFRRRDRRFNKLQFSGVIFNLLWNVRYNVCVYCYCAHRADALYCRRGTGTKANRGNLWRAPHVLYVMRIRGGTDASCLLLRSWKTGEKKNTRCISRLTNRTTTIRRIRNYLCRAGRDVFASAPVSEPKPNDRRPVTGLRVGETDLLPHACSRGTPAKRFSCVSSDHKLSHGRAWGELLINSPRCLRILRLSRFKTFYLIRARRDSDRFWISK